MIKILVLIFSVLAWIASTNCANILYLSTLPSPSHNIWDKTLAMALRNRGHQITFVTHSPEKSVENFTTIIFEGIYKKMKQEYNADTFLYKSRFLSIILMNFWLDSIVNFDLETKGFQEFKNLVDKKPKFDVIIKDTSNGGEFLYPLIEKLGMPPMIGTSPIGILGSHIFNFGIDNHFAYYPHFILPYTDKMSFFERVQNYIYTSISNLYGQYIQKSNTWKKTKKLFGNNITHYQEIENHFSILLLNYDPVLNYPVSLPPAVIPVGGLHAQREINLPRELKTILDNAKHGVVLLSFGTNLLAKDIKADQKEALIQGLGRLKQTVLWKYEEELTGLPKNIIIKPWLPQNDILAHPNLKAFITHCGMLSAQETMIHGVPVIGVPFIYDQISNMHSIANRKIGKALEYGKLTSDNVFETVNEVVNNKEYKIRAQEISKHYRDQKEDPLSRAVWWVEYVIRNGGAQHLTVASRDIAFYKLNMLDFWALVLITIISTFFISKKLFSKRKSSKIQMDIKKKKN